MGGSRDLYFFEVESGLQTQQFSPTHYVDIGTVEPRKQQACMIHVSQVPADLYALHEEMHRVRGREAGVELAEAFARHTHVS